MWENLDVSQPCGPSPPVTGIALPFFLPFILKILVSDRVCNLHLLTIDKYQ
jgi:hypothetical protein